MAQDNRNRPGDETVHYVTERQKRSKQRSTRAMQPPLTPMIDVTFQLLIFFLLACQFKVAEGQILAKLPPVAAGNSPPMQVDPIEVALEPAGDRGASVRWRVRNAVVSSDPKVLRARLIRLREDLGDEVPILVKPGAGVRWRWAVEAFNQAVRAEFKKIAFADLGS